MPSSRTQHDRRSLISLGTCARRSGVSLGVICRLFGGVGMGFVVVFVAWWGGGVDGLGQDWSEYGAPAGESHRSMARDFSAPYRKLL